MTEKMLKFTEIDQETPNKRGTEKKKVISTKYMMSS